MKVSELVPPESEYPLLTDEHLAHCDAAIPRFGWFPVLRP